MPRHVLAQEDGDRIGLLAGGAAEHPDPQLVGRPLAFEELGHDLRLEDLELLGVAEELRHADEQVVEEVLRLGRLGPQELDIAADVVLLHDLHAALDAPQEGVLLVAVEVVPGALAQDGRDPAERIGRFGEARFEALALVETAEMAGVGLDPLRDGLGRQEEVGERAGRGARRELERALLRSALGDGEAALLLQRRDAERAVAGAAVKHDADRPLALGLGKGDEEAVDRRALARPLLRLAGAEFPVPEGQDDVRI